MKISLETFLIVFVPLLAFIGGVAVAFGADETQYIEDGNCYVVVKEVNSIFGPDSKTVERYCKSTE